MWPFTPKTLYDRYRRLMKLIKSIDSHFEVIENKKDSVRLHLPNYKGNQSMDFHIYLLEPFLFISFVTDIEGEKVSCLNNFDQNTDQQDMFNTAMANNLEKVHQALNKKHTDTKAGSKKEQEKHSPQNDAIITENENTNDNSWDLRDYYDFEKSFKKHALTIVILRPGIEFLYYASNESTPLWMYNGELFCYKNESLIGASAFIWIMKHYNSKDDFCYILDLLDESTAHLWIDAMKDPQELISEIQQNDPSFKLGNSPEKVKISLQWSWIDLQSILYFIKYSYDSLAQIMERDSSVEFLQDCSSIEDLLSLFARDIREKKTNVLKDKSEEVLRKETPIEERRDSNIINCWTMKEFFMENGRTIKRVPCTNRETGEKFAMLAFGKKFVGFSKGLGELNDKELNNLKNDLMVVQLKVDERTIQSRREIGVQEESYRLYIKNADLEKVYLTLKKQREESALNLTTEVTEEDLANAWVDKYGVKYSANKKRLLKANKNLTTYSIGIGTVIICDGAFDNCRLLTSLNISNSIERIGKYAFGRCSSLMKILLPKSVTDIYDRAFYDCVSLESVTMLGPVNIGKNIFLGCDKLALIYNPSWSGRIDLHEYNELIDRTQDYPFVSSWSIDEFIEMYGEMFIEERIIAETSESLEYLVFKNSFGKVYAGDKYYWGGEKLSVKMKANKHIRIGQDNEGKYWLYDRTLDFWLPGMIIPY